MTDGNGYVWPTEPPKAPPWLSIPDAKFYEVSHRGKVRSFKRNPNGAQMNPHVDPDGYRRFNYTDDKGERQTNVHVARAVLLAYDPREDSDQLHVCHGPGGPGDNRWPENIRWDTPDVNRKEALAVRLENTPPKPPKECPRCGAEHRERGKNCQSCFEGIGVEFTRLLVDGVPPEEAAGPGGVDYPLNGALNLALRYGGLRFVTEAGLNVMLRAASNAASPSQRLRSVLFRRGASRGNSDRA